VRGSTGIWTQGLVITHIFPCIKIFLNPGNGLWLPIWLDNSATYGQEIRVFKNMVDSLYSMCGAEEYFPNKGVGRELAYYTIVF
jgi:hypothetical protein